jgi:hypothetical protein
MPAENNQPSTRRPRLQGLDAKALLAVGLEPMEGAGQQPTSKPPGQTSRRKLIVGVLLIGLAVVVALLLSPRHTESTDLLASLDTGRALQRGDWRKHDHALESTHPDQVAMMSLTSASLGDYYDIQFAFTRLSGDKSVALFFRTPQGMGSLEFDTWEQPGLSGVQIFDDADLRQSGSFHFLIENGKSYEFHLVVRPDDIRVLHEGKLLHSYPLSGRRLSISSPWYWSEEWSNTTLALGSWHSTTRFSKVVVKRIP